MQEVNGATNEWTGQPYEYDADEVANRIVAGDEIYSIFIVPGGAVLGPKFRRWVYQNGDEGIELEQDIEGRRARDLVLF